MSRTAPRALGPDSWLWRYAGDRRLALVGFSGGVLQLMHPGLGAGVAEHSSFFEDPWARIIRSVPQILGVVYDPHPEVVGRRVRDYHRHIHGIDSQGRRYRALNPETFWWAHATFQFMVEQLIDRFDTHRLTAGERRSLYLDGVEWYRRYGVSARAVPPDYAAFRRQWSSYCNEVLEMTPAAARALDMALHPGRHDPVPFLPAWSLPFQRFTVTPLVRLTTIGGLPPVVRRRFGIPWRVDEEMELRSLEFAVRQSFRLMPDSWRLGPIANAGRRAAADPSAAPPSAPAGAAA
ncbi:MAG TPA: oxygenase MpaB family protein [Acidimicrobiales bacterium]|nr:oxygenase MpaB family protein [Acidimicrobiales bacterium]